MIKKRIGFQHWLEDRIGRFLVRIMHFDDLEQLREGQHFEVFVQQEVGGEVVTAVFGSRVFKFLESRGEL